MRAISILDSILAVTTLATLGSACTPVSPDDTNPFGTAPPMTSAPPSTNTGDETETTGGSSSDGGGETSTGPALTTAPLDSSTSGPPLTTGVSMEDSTTSGGGGTGVQPNTGMWMPCEVPQDCDYAPALCITITDDMDNVLGGFCSDVGCQNAAADCDPSPIATAVPVCVPVTVNMMADMACALQCTGGTACPTPMECLEVTGFGEICV